MVYRYEHHDAEGKWWRAHGNEDWEFAPNGESPWWLAQLRQALTTAESWYPWSCLVACALELSSLSADDTELLELFVA